MDSDGLDDDLKQDGVNLIALHEETEDSRCRCLGDANLSDSSRACLFVALEPRRQVR